MRDIGAMLAAVTLMGMGATLAPIETEADWKEVEERRLARYGIPRRREPEPVAEPIPSGTYTRQQRRAYERGAAGSRSAPTPVPAQ